MQENLFELGRNDLWAVVSVGSKRHRQALVYLSCSRSELVRLDGQSDHYDIRIQDQLSGGAATKSSHMT
jgi:hypothetical protein